MGGGGDGRGSLGLLGWACAAGPGLEVGRLDAAAGWTEVVTDFEEVPCALDSAA